MAIAPWGVLASGKIRTDEEEEDLGLKDMKVENYEDDAQPSAAAQT